MLLLWLVKLVVWLVGCWVAFAFVLVGVGILVFDSVAIVLAFVLVLIGCGFVVA